MLADVVALLRCPVCGEGLRLDPTSVRCAAGHTFDIARQGYVNLLAGAAHGTADTPAMVAARAAFLGAGHYAALAEAVSAAAGPGSGPVVESGAGTGYYVASVLRDRPRSVGVALDISVAASRRAARAHPRLGAVVADAWARLPLADACAEVVLVVFAPRGGAEIARVMRPGGRLVVLTPQAGHLRELVAPLGLLAVDVRKPERLRVALDPWFEPVATRQVDQVLTLTALDVERVAAMGPSAFHTAPDELRRLVASLSPPVTVTVAVTVSTFSRR